MSNVIGDEKGIELIKRMLKSENKDVKEYAIRTYNALKEKSAVYYSDMEEQLKKKLNNQPVYKMYYDTVNKKWKVELWMTPS